MTTRQNLTIYNEGPLIEAIEKFMKIDDSSNFTASVTKLVKKGLRSEGLLKEPKP